MPTSKNGFLLFQPFARSIRGEAAQQTTTADIRYRLAFVAVSLCIPGLVLSLLARTSVPIDFDLQWLGLRALAAGANPYDVVGPDGEYFFPFPYYYPLTATVLVWPLGFLSIAFARAVFILGSAGILAWVASRHGDRWIPMLLSGSFIHAVALGQWTPLLTAALLAPTLGVVTIAKPHLGIAIAVSHCSRRFMVASVGGGMVLFLASLALHPTWPVDWLVTLRAAPAGSHTAPMLQIGGPLILFALLRWRQPEARLLVAMAAIPQTGVLYDTLPLFLVSRTRKEAWVLCAFSLVAYAVQTQLANVMLGEGMGGDFITPFNAFRSRVGAWMVWLMYIPALAIVLLRKDDRVGNPKSMASLMRAK